MMTTEHEHQLGRIPEKVEDLLLAAPKPTVDQIVSAHRRLLSFFLQGPEEKTDVITTFAWETIREKSPVLQEIQALKQVFGQAGLSVTLEHNTQHVDSESGRMTYVDDLVVSLRTPTA